MIKIYNIADLKIFSDRIGSIYGTEDWCLFLYSLVKMHKPKTILELGCGCAATTMWMAQAVKENEAGHIWTVDDGRDWQNVLEGNDNLFLGDEKIAAFPDYIAHLTQKFELEGFVSLISDKIPPFPSLEAKIDLLFSDFSHGANEIIKILGHYLPQMSECSSIFIDSASTAFPSYALLEMLLPQLNQGKIPRTLLAAIDEKSRKAALEFVRNSQFTLVHITEDKHRSQNSTAWLKIQPVDIRPYPRTNFH